MTAMPPDPSGFPIEQSEHPDQPAAKRGRGPNIPNLQKQAPLADETPPDKPQPTLLTQHGRTRLSIVATSAPWELEIDALVIPVGVKAGLGEGLAAAWLSRLGRDDAELFRSLTQTLLADRTPPELRAAAPLVVPLPDNFRSYMAARFAILATAFAPGATDADLDSAGQAAQAVTLLAAERGLHRLCLPLLGSGVGKLPPTEVARAMLRAVLETPRDPRLGEVIISSPSPEAVAAAQEAVQALLGQRLRDLSNDLTRGQDLLSIEGEVSALAEGLLLRDLQPPLVVGILGGWGSGKSFVMHLMYERMAEIRSEPMPAVSHTGDVSTETPPFPYVGHVYLIKFDAWTYAKSNLWASLMQTIFYELNQQLTLEQKLRDLGQDDLQGGDIWRILFEMDEAARERWLADPSAAEALAQLQNKEASEDLLWTTLRDLKRREREILHQMETQLANKRQALEEAHAQLQKEVGIQIEKDARDQAWLPLQNLLRSTLGTTYERFKQLATTAPTGAGAAVGGGTEVSAPPVHALPLGLADLGGLIQRNWVEALAFALFFAATLLLPWLSHQFDNYGLPGGALALGALLVEAIRTQQKWQHVLADSWAAYQQQVREARARLEAERPHRLKQELEKQAAEAQKAQDDPVKLAQLNTVPALEMEVQKLEGQTKRQRERVGLTANTVSLADFVSTRLSAADYEQQLGLMHQVQRDLKELAAGLSAQPLDEQVPTAADNYSANAGTADQKTKGERERDAGIRRSLFPRGPARIVLFVDDLDRCPPDKVVEVLEATQLLVKSPLFVVILAMDVRFITRALEVRYERILMRKGRPSGLDYIEKIIQIPYQVRSIEARALPRYLNALMGPLSQPAGSPTPAAAAGGAGGAAGPTGGGSGGGQAGAARRSGLLPTRALAFSPAELAFLQRCCEHVDLTPRAVKRLVNVYRLIKLIWARPNPVHQPPLPVEQAMIVLLALSGRYPDQMRDLLEALQPDIERPGSGAFIDFFASHRQTTVDAFELREWDRLLDDVRALMPAEEKSPAEKEPAPLALAAMSIENFNLVRSFSFVGDIGYQPGDLTPAGPPPELQPEAKPKAAAALKG